MADTDGMKIRFNKNIVFSWGHILAICLAVFSAGGIYVGMQESIHETAKETKEVSERQVARAVLVDSKLEKINENIGDLKKDIAISQNNQAIISGQIKQLQDYLMDGRAKAAVYRMSDGNN